MQPQTDDGESPTQSKTDIIKETKSSPKIINEEPMVKINKNGLNEEQEQQNGEKEKNQNGLIEDEQEENKDKLKEQKEEDANENENISEEFPGNRKLTIPLIRVDNHTSINESESEKAVDDESSKANEDGSDQSVNEPTPDTTPVSTPTSKTRRSARLLQESFSSYTEEMLQDEEVEEEEEEKEELEDEKEQEEEEEKEEVEEEEEKEEVVQIVEEEDEEIEEIEIEKPPPKEDKQKVQLSSRNYSMPVITARRPLRTVRTDKADKDRLMQIYRTHYMIKKGGDSTHTSNSSFSESMITHDGYTDTDSDNQITNKRKADFSPETPAKKARLVSSTPGFLSKISSPFKYFSTPKKDQEKKIEIGSEAKEDNVEDELEEIDLKCSEPKNAGESSKIDTTPKNNKQWCNLM